MTQKEKQYYRDNNLPIVDENGEIIELPRYKTLQNIHLFPPVPGVINKSPSKTVPGQDMTVSQLISRFNAGLTVPSVDVEFLENEVPLPLIKDLTDYNYLDQYINEAKERIEAAKKLSDEKKIEELKKREDELRAKIAAELELLQQNK